MAGYKPWRDKSYLEDRYVKRRMTIDKIADECVKAGYSVTAMTIFNNLKSFDIPIRGGSRKLASRSVGGGTKSGFYG
jgi:hypothetical protein